MAIFKLYILLSRGLPDTQDTEFQPANTWLSLAAGSATSIQTRWAGTPCTRGSNDSAQLIDMSAPYEATQLCEKKHEISQDGRLTVGKGVV